MKKIALLSITIASLLTPVWAYSSMNIDGCHFKVPYDIDLEQKSVVVSRRSKPIFKIDGQNQLYIDEKKQSLNSTQQQLVSELGNEYRKLVPGIAIIAGEAAEIALKAATLTLNTLFSDDPGAMDDVLVKLDKVSEKIAENVNENHFSGSTDLEQDLGDDFGTELEVLVEEVVASVSGKVFLSTLKQIFSSDEVEQKDLEFRMEMFAEDMEIQIEDQAKELEIAAKSLCDNFVAIDEKESLLQKSLDSFAEIDIVQLDE